MAQGITINNQTIDEAYSKYEAAVELMFGFTEVHIAELGSFAAKRNYNPLKGLVEDIVEWFNKDLPEALVKSFGDWSGSKYGITHFIESTMDGSQKQIAVAKEEESRLKRKITEWHKVRLPDFPNDGSIDMNEEHAKEVVDMVEKYIESTWVAANKSIKEIEERGQENQLFLFISFAASQMLDALHYSFQEAIEEILRKICDDFRVKYAEFRSGYGTYVSTAKDAVKNESKKRFKINRKKPT